MNDKPSIPRNARSTDDFFDISGQTKFLDILQNKNKILFLRTQIIHENRGERMLRITSVCPRPHAHEQSEIKEHERARVKLQVKNQYPRRFFHRDNLWVNVHRLTKAREKS